MNRPIVESLDLKSLAVGQTHECWLHILDDGMAQPVLLPLVIVRGGPGPVVGLTAAIHGDEVNGIAVIQQLVQKLDPTRLKGTVAAIPIANASAFHGHSRHTSGGADLNHFFPGAAHGGHVNVYAHRLVERFVQKLDVLVDLHTASRGRVNCLYVRADMTDERTARMAYLHRPQLILNNPASDGTLRGAASELNIPAVTVEVGNPNLFQPEYIRKSVVGVRATLAEWGLISKRPIRLGPPPTLCASSRWVYTDRGGLLTVFPKVMDVVSKGDPIAVIRDAFGHPLKTYLAPDNGVVIGHSRDPVATTGARILHLGKLATKQSAFQERVDV